MGETWPKFFYHESCQEGRKFECEEDVPPGWVTGPHLINSERAFDAISEAIDYDMKGLEMIEKMVDDDPPRRPPGRPHKMRE